MPDGAELSRLDASEQARLCARGDVTAHELCEGQDALLLAWAYQLDRARPWRERWLPYSFPVLFGAD